MYQRKVGSPVQTSGGPPGGPDLGGPRSKNAATFSEKNSPFPRWQANFLSARHVAIFQGLGARDAGSKSNAGASPVTRARGCG